MLLDFKAFQDRVHWRPHLVKNQISGTQFLNDPCIKTVQTSRNIGNLKKTLIEQDTYNEPVGSMISCMLKKKKKKSFEVRSSGKKERKGRVMKKECLFIYENLCLYQSILFCLAFSSCRLKNISLQSFLESQMESTKDMYVHIYICICIYLHIHIHSVCDGLSVSDYMHMTFRVLFHDCHLEYYIAQLLIFCWVSCCWFCCLFVYLLCGYFLQFFLLIK